MIAGDAVIASLLSVPRLCAISGRVVRFMPVDEGNGFFHWEVVNA